MTYASSRMPRAPFVESRMAPPTPRFSTLPTIALLAIGVASLWAIASGCTREERADPRLRTRLLVIEGPALARLLEPTARLEGTPIGAFSASTLEEARTCPVIALRIETGANEETTETDCLEEPLEADSVEAFAFARRGTADGVLFWPIGKDGHLELTVDVDEAGHLDVSGGLHLPTEPGALALLRPSESAPDAALIPSSRTLLHAHMRPEGGLGLTRFLPEDGQADRMFALKGRLLEGALLRGTWEMAFMPPTEGGALPLAIIALHHRAAAPLEEALDEALSRLEATWPIERAPKRFETADGTSIEGACFPDLPLLPELEPCWVVDDRAFFIGYRAEALEAVFARPAVSSNGMAPGGSGADPSGEDMSRLVVDLEEMARSDRAAGRGALSGNPHLGELFSRLSVGLMPGTGNRIEIRARLARPTS